MDFWAHVDRSGGPESCWPWLAGSTGAGYGSATDPQTGRKTTASRVALGLSLGRAVADDREACHSCDTPRCCNPAHLFEGTHAENMADMASKGRNNGPRLSGERHHRAKLTADAVERIRGRLAAGHLQRDIAADFGVSQGAISFIATGVTWRSATAA